MEIRSVPSHLAVAGAQSLGEAGGCDVVSLLHVLHTLPDQSCLKVLQAAHASLAPEGVLIVKVQHPDCYLYPEQPHCPTLTEESWGRVGAAG